VEGPPAFEVATFAWRLGAAAFFLLLNGFFVAAEFALVKVRASRLDTMAEERRAARIALRAHGELDRYLSACQLGITISSLVLGWLAEPAVAELLLAGAAAAGIAVAAGSAWLHALALALALTLITLAHMTIGEQAPKIFAIRRPESTALVVAGPLRVFAAIFQPFVALVHAITNALLRAVGLDPEEIPEGSAATAEDLRQILAQSAASGHLSGRQEAFAQNVIRMVELEVRHVMLPRIDVDFLSLQNAVEENLRVMREKGHSRFPVCRVGLDSVIGFVHAKDVYRSLAEGGPVDLRKLARKPLFVSDTQPLARLILQLQRAGAQVAVVLDEHGTAVGLAFLEDAIEEIVGPIRDEFDEPPVGVKTLAEGVFEMPGALPLPEARELLELTLEDEEADTIGGYMTALLGRLPQQGDTLDFEGHRATVLEVQSHRIARLRVEPAPASRDLARTSTG
jgi:CBS domain containing-hemolysin-like protein